MERSPECPHWAACQPPAPLGVGVWTTAPPLGRCGPASAALHLLRARHRTPAPQDRLADFSGASGASGQEEHGACSPPASPISDPLCDPEQAELMALTLYPLVSSKEPPVCRRTPRRGMFREVLCLEHHLTGFSQRYRGNTFRRLCTKSEAFSPNASRSQMTSQGPQSHRPLHKGQP